MKCPCGYEFDKGTNWDKPNHPYEIIKDDEPFKEIEGSFQRLPIGIVWRPFFRAADGDAAGGSCETCISRRGWIIY